MKRLLTRAIEKARGLRRATAAVAAPAGIDFQQDGINRDRFDRLMQRPAPTLTYVIYFTPRSGSSRITDICNKTKTLSSPGEIFSQNNVPGIAKSLGARNLQEYVDVASRWRATKGVFGCEMTYGMIRSTFQTPRNFINHLGGGPSFWLIREDIVAQAVSLSSKFQSRVGHAVSGNEEEVARARELFTYDRDDIHRWVRHVLNFETKTENIFKTFELTPLRLSYEKMVPLRPRAVANVIADHIGVAPVRSNNLESEHKKIGTSKNVDFSQRFMEEEKNFLRGVAEKRAPYLAKLVEDPWRDVKRRREQKTAKN